MYLTSWFFAWSYGWLPQDQQSLLSYHGLGSWLTVPEAVWWGYFALTLVGYAGMLLYRRTFRVLFVVLIFVGLVTAPMLGVSVVTGVEVFLIDASTLLQGVAVGRSFFSPVSERFY